MTASISDKSLNKIVSEKTEKNKLSLPKSIKMSDSPRIGSDCKFLIPILNPAGVVCKRKKSITNTELLSRCYSFPKIEKHPQGKFDSL